MVKRNNGPLQCLVVISLCRRINQGRGITNIALDRGIMEALSKQETTEQKRGCIKREGLSGKSMLGRGKSKWKDPRWCYVCWVEELPLWLEQREQKGACRRWS